MAEEQADGANSASLRDQVQQLSALVQSIAERDQQQIQALSVQVKTLQSRLEQEQASKPVMSQTAALAATPGDATPGSPPAPAPRSGAQSPSTASVGAGGDVGSQRIFFADGRPTFRTPDGNFTATLHGVMQFDSAVYDQDKSGPLSVDQRRDGPALGASTSNVDAAHARNLRDGDFFRRARIGIDGTAYGDWDYRILFDFGGSATEDSGQLYEAWAQYSGFRPLKFRIGAFAASGGMDDQASTNGMPFLERATSSDMVRNLAAGDARTGAEIFANGQHWLISAAVTGKSIGVINTGTGISTPQTFGDQLGFVGRMTYDPFHGDDWLIHVGVHGSYVDRPADASGPSATGATAITSEVIGLSNTIENRVDGTKLINTGSIDARHADSYGFEFAAQKQNFLIQSEYENFGVDRDDGFSSPNFHGYYVFGTWTLTGEARKYNSQTAAFDAPPISHPFSLTNGGWGAWELGLRYSDMDLNYQAGAAGTAQAGSSIRGGDAQDFTAGLNWYINPVIRFMFDYQHVRIDRLSPATSAAAASTLWLTPLGAQIGQTYDVISLRSQVAF